jgi:hypothetical protein
MKKYNFENVDNICFSLDKINSMEKYHSILFNRLLILKDNISLDKMNKNIKELNKKFKDNGAYVVFMRGNENNPDYFDGEKINYSNIIAVPDYSILSTKFGNILIIGGQLSVNRSWKKKHGNYWENEMPKFDEMSIKEIGTEKLEINVLISSVSPSFCTENEADRIEPWLSQDKTLKEDAMAEREIMDKIYLSLVKQNTKPKTWLYNDSVSNNEVNLNEIRFTGLGTNFTYLNNIMQTKKDNGELGIFNVSMCKNDYTWAVDMAEPVIMQAPIGRIVQNH